MTGPDPPCAAPPKYGMVRSDHARRSPRLPQICPPPPPPPLPPTPPSPSAGRPPELAILPRLVPWADDAGRRIVLLGGEAGAGKSRLVREFAAEVAAEGALVLYGGCDA